MSLSKFLSVICALLVTAEIANAQSSDEIASGEELAQEYCQRCHDIEAGGAFKLYPPSFAAIAVYRSEEQIYGRIVFPALHSSMPQLATIMEPRNIDYLVAYILSLEIEE